MIVKCAFPIAKLLLDFALMRDSFINCDARRHNFYTMAIHNTLTLFDVVQYFVAVAVELLLGV